MCEKRLYSILLPLRLEWLPIYISSVALRLGQSVKVELSSREYIGIVWKEEAFSQIGESQYSVKEIISADTSIPDLSEEQMALWDFISSYYLCSLGEVYKAARPQQSIQSEQAAARQTEALRAKIDKLEQSLLRRHRPDIVERLHAELADARAQLDQGQANSPRFQEKPESRLMISKPKLLVGRQLTHEYLCLIEQILNNGGQVLVLTPEIIFCDKLEEQLSQKLGDKLWVVNSHKTAAHRREVSRLLRSATSMVVLGTRSAIFLPFNGLRLVIVDNEQDISYKQTEPAPRYHCRDAAIYLASIHRAQVVLGSPSPSFESLYNCERAKFVYEAINNTSARELQKNGFLCDNCEIVDITAERRKNGMVGAISRKLIRAVELHRSGPIILLRQWEKEDELKGLCRELFPKRDIAIMTLREFKSSIFKETALVAVLQADAYLSKDDFRSDERAAQLREMLCAVASKVVIQTAMAMRFDGSRPISQLMAERRDFGYPPYTRIIDIHRKGTNELLSRNFIPKDSSFVSKKSKLAASLNNSLYADVDPI